MELPLLKSLGSTSRNSLQALLFYPTTVEQISLLHTPPPSHLPWPALLRAFSWLPRIWSPAPFLSARDVISNIHGISLLPFPQWMHAGSHYNFFLPLYPHSSPSYTISLSPSPAPIPCGLDAGFQLPTSIMQTFPKFTFWMDNFHSEKQGFRKDRRLHFQEDGIFLVLPLELSQQWGSRNMFLWSSFFRPSQISTVSCIFSGFQVTCMILTIAKEARSSHAFLKLSLRQISPPPHANRHLLLNER